MWNDLAQQLQVPAESWSTYDWKGRTIKYHRAAIRSLLGFRESTLADAEAVLQWATEHVLPLEQDLERIKEQILNRYRALRWEPLASDHLDRLVRSAVARYEGRLCSTLIAQLSPDCRTTLDALLAGTDGPPSEAESEEKARVPLHDLRTEPGKANLQTLQEELAKLERVRSLGLPGELQQQIPPRLLRAWRQQVAVEELYELRRHPEPFRWALLTAYCLVRQQELTDTLVDILLAMVHRITARAEERVHVTDHQKTYFSGHQPVS